MEYAKIILRVINSARSSQNNLLFFQDSIFTGDLHFYILPKLAWVLLVKNAYGSKEFYHVKSKKERTL